MKKYELTDETKVFEGRTMHRIRALRDFGIVKSGDIGGWVESEHNLSQYGDCWIFSEGVVMGNGVVTGNALVRNSAVVMGNALVMDNALVMENGVVKDHGYIMCRGMVRGNQVLTKNALLIGGLQWPVTIGDDFINIKDASLAHGELLSMTRWELLRATKEYLPDFEDAFEFWEQYGKLLKSMVKNYRGEK